MVKHMNYNPQREVETAPEPVTKPAPAVEPTTVPAPKETPFTPSIFPETTPKG